MWVTLKEYYHGPKQLCLSHMAVIITRGAVDQSSQSSGKRGKARGGQRKNGQAICGKESANGTEYLRLLVS